MTSLTVWGFDTPWAADAAEVRLKRLRELGDIEVHDTAVVMWPHRDAHPRVRRHKRRDAAAGDAWDRVLDQLSGEIAEGTSALCVLSSSGKPEAVQQMISKDPGMRLLMHQSDSPLANDLLEKLRAEQSGANGGETPRSG